MISMTSNNEKYNQIIDEVYENYSKEYEKDNSIGLTLLVQRVDGKSVYRKPDKQMFIGLCTYDKTFSQKWGLKIEERELSLEERCDTYMKWSNDPKCIEWKNHIENEMGWDYKKPEWVFKEVKDQLDKAQFPTKLITLTYKDKTIEVYEYFR